MPIPFCSEESTRSVGVKGTVRRYRSCAACEIITKRNFTRINEIYNKQWWKDCTKRDLVVLESIMRAGKVLTISRGKGLLGSL